jgi:hypothetical protein
MRIMPVAFGWLAGEPGSTRSGAAKGLPAAVKSLIGRARSLFMKGRYLFGPITIFFYAPAFYHAIQAFQPDLVHALRIPFEGMLASFGPSQVPFAVSIWGNDLTLHARGSSLMSSLTRRVLHRACGLLADARRDLRLANEWGLDPACPTLEVPGSGGIDLVEISRARDTLPYHLVDSLPAGVPLVINPRGLRPGSVRTDTFFKAIPLVLKHAPQATFLCPAMDGQVEAQRWLDRLEIGARVRLMPALSQAALWDLFHRAEVLISVSEHDGTPNSVLEGMACGCFPIVGDIESLREWITGGLNGLLVDPGDPVALANAILQAINDPDLRCRAAEINHQIIADRAEVSKIREEIEKFYRAVVKK